MRPITVQCSPDADDLFMMRALTERLIDTGDYAFRVDTSPTDALNTLASGEGPDVCAISLAHYPAVAHRYLLLPHGGSMGEGYGPVVVAREPMALADLAGKRVAVPGLTTTAYKTLQMMVQVEPVITPISPYSLIFEELRAGRVDAGLIIHEGRLTFADEGFVQVADIGAWWAEQTGGLPLPLGANAIRRDLEEPTITEVSDLLRRAIRHGLDHLDDAVDWLLAQGGALGTRERVREYLGMYANERTYDYGDAGRAGIEAYLERAAAQGLLPACRVEFSA